MAESPNFASSIMPGSGGLDAGTTRRLDLMRQAQRIYGGEAKVSEGEKRRMTDTAVQQVGAGLEAQSQELGQMALAGSPRDMGRFQRLQREIGQEGIAAGMAQASAETERIAQAREMAEKQAFDAALERQQQLDWQKEQYYVQQAMDVLGIAAQVAGASM